MEAKEQPVKEVEGRLLEASLAPRVAQQLFQTCLEDLQAARASSTSQPKTNPNSKTRRPHSGLEPLRSPNPHKPSQVSSEGLSLHLHLQGLAVLRTCLGSLGRLNQPPKKKKRKKPQKPPQSLDRHPQATCLQEQLKLVSSHQNRSKAALCLEWELSLWQEQICSEVQSQTRKRMRSKLKLRNNRSNNPFLELKPKQYRWQDKVHLVREPLQLCQAGFSEPGLECNNKSHYLDLKLKQYPWQGKEHWVKEPLQLSQVGFLKRKKKKRRKQ